MGSTIMHLGISQMLKKKYNFSNDFLVGTIAPDIIKKLPNTDRATTHYLKEYKDDGKIKRLPDIDKFLNDNINEQSDYFYGYLAHLLQDRIWFKKYVPMCAEYTEEGAVRFLKNNTIHIEEDFSEEMYKDYAAVGEYILSGTDLDLEIIKLETKAYFKDELINDIADNEIKIYVPIKNRENCFLSNEMITNYFNDCIEECDKYISERKK